MYESLKARVGIESVGRIIQYALGIVALGWITTQVRFSAIVAVVLDLPTWTFVTLACLTIGQLFGISLLWRALIGPFGSPSPSQLVQAELLFGFVDQIVPSRVASQSIAPFVIDEFANTGVTNGAAVAVTYTLYHVALYGAVALIGLLIVRPILSLPFQLFLGIAIAAYLGYATMLALVCWRHDALQRIVATVLGVVQRAPVPRRDLSPDTIVPAVGEAAIGVRALASDYRRVVPFALGWLLCLVGVPGLRVWLLLEGLGVETPEPWLVAVYVCLAYSVSVLPLTPGSIGVSEATATVVFVALGFPESVVVPTILVDRALGVYLPALAGWYPAIKTDVT
jgi:uncharacterized protein (TIRG00374 family)